MQDSRKYLLWTAMLLWLGVWHGILIANQTSNLHYSLGVQHFTAGDYQQARADFLKSQQADPQHFKAAYYAIYCLERLGQDQTALVQARQLVESNPQQAQAHKLLGMLLLKLKQPQQARLELQQAVELAPRDAEAFYYRGVAEQSSAAYEASLQSFARAAAIDAKMELLATYSAALTHLKLDDQPQAIAKLEMVRHRAPDSSYGKEASRMLRELDAAQSVDAQRRWQGFAAIGTEYDSNVILEPDAIDISEEEDLRFLANLGGSWRPIPALALQYSLYQNQHLELDSFNVQSHQLGLELKQQQTYQDKSMQYGVSASSAMTLLSNDFDYFSWVQTLEPYLTRDYSANYNFALRAHLHYADFRSDDDVRDNLGYGFTIVQLWQLLQQQAFIGLKTGLLMEDAERDYDLFKFSGVAQLGFSWQQILFTGQMGFEHGLYYRNSASRQDDRLTAGLNVSRPIAAVNLSVGYQFTHNNSNVVQFEYFRHLVSLNLSYAF